MPNIQIWSGFAKRENSTLLPATDGLTKNVKLKENVSISNPIFILNEVNTAISYVKFDNKYYFVDDITIMSATQSVLNCRIDVLASFKSNILNTSAFVKYYTHDNNEICDTRLSTKTTKEYLIKEGVFDSLGSVTQTNSALILVITGKNSTGGYAIQQSQIYNVINTTLDEVWNDSVDDIDFTDIQNAPDIIDWLCRLGLCVEKFFKSLIGRMYYSGNVIENIKTSILLPLTVGNVATSQTQRLILGHFDSGVDGYVISDRTFNDSAVVDIPWQADDWRRNSPYHELYLYIPYIGVVQLPTSDLIDEETLLVATSVDKFSGDAIFTVTTNNGLKIGQYGTNVATTYPIGVSNVNARAEMGSLVSGAVGTGLALLSGGSAAPLVGAMSAGVGLVNAFTPTNNSISGASGGSIIGISDRSKVKCISIFHDTTVDPSNVSAIFGTPCNAVLSLRSIRGYVQTVGASVSGDMELQERQKINSMLDSGIYIE